MFVGLLVRRDVDTEILFLALSTVSCWCVCWREMVLIIDDSRSVRPSPPSLLSTPNVFADDQSLHYEIDGKVGIRVVLSSPHTCSYASYYHSELMSELVVTSDGESPHTQPQAPRHRDSLTSRTGDWRLIAIRRRKKDFFGISTTSLPLTFPPQSGSRFRTRFWVVLFTPPLICR